ncbi:hypothetical protein GMDG_01449 [Pseudogymnoascus destructans 20631-21]|uniref:Uncharacterized protein n=2 Tax=Pseudogymnoascus destructans TaxID=655981 RepID=L8FT59_PSED2|nr:hypothetical protein GMDG_01449 [Pseudogymnoascus destructans 20631-21]
MMITEVAEATTNISTSKAQEYTNEIEIGGSDDDVMLEHPRVSAQCATAPDTVGRADEVGQSGKNATNNRKSIAYNGSGGIQTNEPTYDRNADGSKRMRVDESARSSKPTSNEKGANKGKGRQTNDDASIIQDYTMHEVHIFCCVRCAAKDDPNSSLSCEIAPGKDSCITCAQDNNTCLEVPDRCIILLRDLQSAAQDLIALDDNDDNGAHLQQLFRCCRQQLIASLQNANIFSSYTVRSLRSVDVRTSEIQAHLEASLWDHSMIHLYTAKVQTAAATNCHEKQSVLLADLTAATDEQTADVNKNFKLLMTAQTELTTAVREQTAMQHEDAVKQLAATADQTEAIRVQTTTLANWLAQMHLTNQPPSGQVCFNPTSFCIDDH